MKKTILSMLLTALALTALAAAPARSLAVIDLSIESARTEPVQGTANTGFTFAVLIKNLGNTQAKIKPGCFRYRLTTDPATGYKDVLNPTPNPYILAPGQSVECKGQPRTSLPAGLVTVQFLVENNISDVETNKQNNTYYLQVPVANPSTGYVGKPDLYFSKNPSFSTGKSSSGVGEEVSVYAYIGNRGDADALVPKGAVLWNVTEGGKVLAEDKRFDQNYLYRTGSKDDWRWAKLPSLTPGTHNLVINLDPQNVIKEKNDAHPPAYLTLNVQVPDLAVSLQSLAGKTFKTKDTIPLWVTVRNNGFVPASFPQGSIFLSYGAKGFPYSKYVMASPYQLGPYGEYKMIYQLPPFTNTPGTYTVEVWADPNNVTRDSRPADNKATSTVTIVAESIKGAISGATPTNPKPKPAPAGAIPRIEPPRLVPKPLPGN